MSGPPCRELPHGNRALTLSCGQSIGCSSKAEGCSPETWGNWLAVSSWIYSGSRVVISVSLQHPAGGGVSSTTRCEAVPTAVYRRCTLELLEVRPCRSARRAGAPRTKCITIRQQPLRLMHGQDGGVTPAVADRRMRQVDARLEHARGEPLQGLLGRVRVNRRERPE